MCNIKYTYGSLLYSFSPQTKVCLYYLELLSYEASVSACRHRYPTKFPMYYDKCILLSISFRHTKVFSKRYNSGSLRVLLVELLVYNMHRLLDSYNTYKYSLIPCLSSTGQVWKFVPDLGLPPWRTPAPGEPGWEPILNFVEVKQNEAEILEVGHILCIYIQSQKVAILIKKRANLSLHLSTYNPNEPFFSFEGLPTKNLK